MIMCKMLRLLDLDNSQEILFHTGHELTGFVEVEETETKSSVPGSTEGLRTWLFVGAVLLLDLGLLWLVCTTWHLSPRAKLWLGVFHALNLLGRHVLAHPVPFRQPEVSSCKLSLQVDNLFTCTFCVNS